MINNTDYIENELKKFNITDASINELKEKFMPLTISSVEDKEGFKIVKESRIIVKNYRVEVEKRRKELTSDALKFQRLINDEARRITEMLIPIEEHLSSEEDDYKNKIETIRKEKETNEINKIKYRTNLIINLGFIFNGEYYSCPYLEFKIKPEEIKTEKDKDFDETILKLTPKHDAYLKEIEDQKEKERVEKEEAEKIRQEEVKKQQELRAQESIRLAQIEKQQEEERARLKEIQNQQEEKSLFLKREQERIDEEKKQIEAAIIKQKEDEERRAKDIENKKMLEERRFSLLPDKEKMKNMISYLQGVENPDVISQESKDIIFKFKSKIDKLLQDFEIEIDKL